MEKEPHIDDVRIFGEEMNTKIEELAKDIQYYCDPENDMLEDPADYDGAGAELKQELLELQESQKTFNDLIEKGDLEKAQAIREEYQTKFDKTHRDTVALNKRDDHTY